MCNPSYVQVFFGSVLVVDDGQTAVTERARVKADLCGHSLFQYGLSLLHEIATQFRDVERVIAVTRDDQVILTPRFATGGLQKNKLIGANVSESHV
jgi:hypothetical protein